MKVLVETTGNFQILHAEQRELIRARGITVVEKSQFVHERASIGQLKVRGQANDEATDAEWLETVRESDGDETLALASFLDRFPVDDASARKPEPPPVIPSTVQVKHNQPKASGSHAPKPK